VKVELKAGTTAPLAGGGVVAFDDMEVTLWRSSGA
jgi:hypothetical protein